MGMLGDHRLNDLDDFLLLSPWKLGNLGKDLARFARRFVAGLRYFGHAEKIVGRSSQGYGERSDLFRLQGAVAPFPRGDNLLNHAELLGQLDLSHACLFPCSGKTLPET